MPLEDIPAKTPGYVCPFCGTDASPIAPTTPCPHLFIVDGENGWRLTERSRRLFQRIDLFHYTAPPGLFRDLLYHDPACRAHLRLLRADYDDSLEMYVWSERPDETEEAFAQAIMAAAD